MNPWEDSELLAYRRLIQNDPCSYCGGPGGTVDHIIPRPLGGPRWDPQNWTAACEQCNRRKDRGEPSGHRTILEMLQAQRERTRWQREQIILANLRPGDEVFTPWQESAVVYGILGHNVYCWLPEQERTWRCANPTALRDEQGRRLSEKFPAPAKQPAAA